MKIDSRREIMRPGFREEIKRKAKQGLGTRDTDVSREVLVRIV